MLEQIIYVRGKLNETRKHRGGIAKLSRAVELDRRTVLSVLDTEHNPNAETIEKLLVYFLNEARRTK